MNREGWTDFASVWGNYIGIPSGWREPVFRRDKRGVRLLIGGVTDMRIFICLLTLSVLVGCGGSRVAPTTPSSTATPAPVPVFTPPATVAVPDDHRGNPIDFLRSVLAGDDARARQYLAPGVYANVASLRAMLGLPKPSGSYNLGTYPVEATDQRVIEECIVRIDGMDYWVRIVVAPVGTMWLITEVGKL